MLNVAFRSREVKMILAGLDSFGGTDPLGLFPLLLNEAAPVLAPKLSTLFRLLFRQGRFPLSWRIANITPIPRVRRPHVPQTIVLFQLLQFCQKFLKNHLRPVVNVF